MKKLLITTLMAAFCWTAFVPCAQAQDTTRRKQDTTKKHDPKSKMPKDKKKDKRDTTHRRPDTTATPMRPN